MSSPSFDDRDGQIWYDGEMLDWRDAKLHVLSHALHYASSVFEGVRVYNGKAFKLTEHSQRLVDSATMLGMAMPYTVEELDAATLKTIEANNIVDGYIRPVAWRGSEMMGVSAQDTKTHVAIATWAWPSYFSPEMRAKGIRLTLSPWKRPAPDTAPVHAKAAGLYMICTMSKHAAEDKGFDDAIFQNWKGQLAEGTGANIFLLMPDGKLHTPTPDCFLNGITRQTVMELAKRRGLEVVEREIEFDELANAQEVFVTGTAAEVTPVGQIDDYSFTPGKVCQMMIEDYDKEVGKTV
ncbi:MAG: branched-chain amino acid aminotransferase [Rhodospirillales bacterium]|nr:branched-chain amino acid aminotransferase [Rhodospirillales bacterium]